MRTRWLVPALLAGLLAALPASAAAKRTVPLGWVGTVMSFEVTSPAARLDSEVALMRKSGVEAVRANFFWASAQPTRTGPINWLAFDPSVAAAAKNGLTMIPTVLLAPKWAAINPRDPFPQPTGTQGYARFMTKLIGRYGPHGTFWSDNPTLPYHPIRTWEIWSEPDLKYFWLQPWETSYIRLLRAAHAAVKAADPGAHVVLAGLTYHSWIDIEEIYKRGGRGLFDAVDLHPYARTPAQSLKIVELVRKVLNAHRNRQIPIQVGEIGWTSSQGRTPRFFAATTPAGQARDAATMLPLFATARRKLNISGVFWYSWLSPDKSRIEPFDYAGLRTLKAGKPVAKPAFSAFRRAALRLEGR